MTITNRIADLNRLSDLAGGLPDEVIGGLLTSLGVALHADRLAADFVDSMVLILPPRPLADLAAGLEIVRRSTGSTDDLDDPLRFVCLYLKAAVAANPVLT